MTYHPKVHKDQGKGRASCVCVVELRFGQGVRNPRAALHILERHAPIVIHGRWQIWLNPHKQIARVRVGVEQPVHIKLLEVHITQPCRQLQATHPQAIKGLQIVDLHSADALHH